MKNDSRELTIIQEIISGRLDWMTIINPRGDEVMYHDYSGLQEGEVRVVQFTVKPYITPPHESLIDGFTLIDTPVEPYVIVDLKDRIFITHPIMLSPLQRRNMEMIGYRYKPRPTRLSPSYV